MLVTNLTTADIYFGPLHLPAGIGQTLTVDDTSATSLYLTNDSVTDALNNAYSALRISVSGQADPFPRPTGVPQILHGDGSPDGLVFASQGSVFMRRDNQGAGNALYAKTTGTTISTGWQAFGGTTILLASTTLPGTPFDGQETILVDSVTAPTYQWRFRYNAGSLNTDKWEFVGGAPGRATDVNTQQNTVVSSYGALTTPGPSFAIPRPGVYDVTLSAAAAQGVANKTSYMSYDIGGAAAVDADAMRISVANALNVWHHSMMTRRKTLTAVTLTAKYRTDTSGSADFRDRMMIVTPVRVS